MKQQRMTMRRRALLVHGATYLDFDDVCSHLNPDAVLIERARACSSPNVLMCEVRALRTIGPRVWR